MDTGLLSKENSKILRGLGIMCIMLHNFLHDSRFGFAPQNEMFFSSDRTMAFFSSLSNGHFTAQLFSFLGWVGVPVFIFLTGYGVALRTPPLLGGERNVFIKRNYLKLFFLLAPALLVFCVIDVFNHYWLGIVKRSVYLTMMANFVYPFVQRQPGSYWYFGMTFQLYLLWAFAGRYFNKKNLIWLSVIMLGGLYVLCLFDAPKLLSIYRHCFTGWFFVFAFGMYMAQQKNNVFYKIKTSWLLELLLAVAFLVLMLVMNLTLESWVFVPFVALAFFFSLGRLFMRIKPLSMVFHWIGNFSASIFVCHGLVKYGVMEEIFPFTSNVLLLVVIYISLTIVFSLIYEKVYRWLLFRFVENKAVVA